MLRALTIAATAALLAACARAPQAPPVTPGPGPRPSGSLVGLTAAELGARFGQPVLTVRDGPGTKLQWARNGCVLDAFLYPPEGGRGGERVVHVDSRRPSGADLDLAACLGLLGR